MALTPGILDESDDYPQAEDLVIDLLRRTLPDMHWTSLIEQDVPPPFGLVRAVSYTGAMDSGVKFTRSYAFSVETFTSGLESDVEGPRIHMAVESVLTKASYANTGIVDDLGWVVEYELADPSRRVADWANSEGPVQYADLPQGFARFISTHRLTIKRAKRGPSPYDF